MRPVASRRVTPEHLLALVLAACAGEPPSPQPVTPAIIGGSDDPGHDAVVFLSNELVAGCTGTLISSKLVLTAAHCVVDGGVVRVLDGVVFGPSSSSPRRKRGASVVWHPQYQDGFPWHNDVAVIVLASRADVAPVPIATAPPGVGERVTFVGYGLQRSPDGDFGVKQRVTVPVTDVEEQWIYSGPAFCQGDSGGPALRTVDGKEVVAGVISWGEQGCNGTNASQRVDLHVAWLSQQIARLDPPSCERDFRCIAGCASGDADCPCAATDGVCSALCADPEADPDCPRGCGGGDTCVRGPICPAPDPDCGDPCGDQGHCIEEGCATRDPDCPAPRRAGEACARNFDCADGAVCYLTVCTNTCDVASSQCGGGGTCTRLTPQVAVCLQADAGGGCAVAGTAPSWWALLLAAAGAALSRGRRLRLRSRRASSPR